MPLLEESSVVGFATARPGETELCALFLFSELVSLEGDEKAGLEGAAAAASGCVRFSWPRLPNAAVAGGLAMPPSLERDGAGSLCVLLYARSFSGVVPNLPNAPRAASSTVVSLSCRGEVKASCLALPWSTEDVTSHCCLGRVSWEYG